METFNYCVPTIILQPREAITKENADQAQESLSHVCAAITDVCVAKDLVYNLLITDKGMTFYLMLRKKESEIDTEGGHLPYGLGVFDLAGAFYCLNKELYTKMNYKDYFEFCRTKVGLDKTEFNALKKIIVQKLESEYKGYDKA